MTKLICLRWRHVSLKPVEASLSHNRNLLATIPGDGDIKRLREKATLCLLAVQELMAEIEELIEKLEGNCE